MGISCDAGTPHPNREHAAIVGLLDVELQAGVVERRAGRRNLARDPREQAADRFVAVLERGHAEELVQRVERGAAVEQEAAVFEQPVLLRLVVVLVGDLADDLLDDVLDRHQALGAAELVEHDRHLLAPRLELLQELAQVLGVRE